MSLNALFILPMLAAAPYALIETRDTDKTDSKNFQVTVRAIDGKGYFGKHDEMKLEPGFHFIEMSAQGSEMRISAKNLDKSLYLVAKPCFRYFVTGQVDSELAKDWKVRVLGNERILACKTKEEIEQQKQDKKRKAEEAKQAKRAEAEASESKP